MGHKISASSPVALEDGDQVRSLLWGPDCCYISVASLTYGTYVPDLSPAGILLKGLDQTPPPPGSLPWSPPALSVRISYPFSVLPLPLI